ncbi:MAG TPA: hypothetical protein DCZ95_03410 [Verrucomicrobia bacterium]|nr:MAG: hypothetical protein A2X46_01555 [Lentisphaerae bacterium GWF2_57_35]HBA83121.1 hypothetical protein [Verrucomicrobiota bacterium]
MKLFKWILALVVLAVIAAVAARNMVVRKMAIRAVEQATDFQLDVGTVQVGLFRPTFDIEQVALLNPEDFPEKTAFDIRRIHVRYDFKSLFGDRLHLREVVLDIPTAVMVVKEDGESNLDRLRQAGSAGAEEKSEPSTEEKSSEPEESKAPRSLQIDRLVLKLGRVNMHRYVEGQATPEVKTYDLKIDRTFDDVTSLQQVAGLVAAEIAVRELPNLVNHLDKILKDNDGDLEAAGESLKKTFEGLFR